MFVVRLKTLLIEAARATFDADYVVPEFRSIWVSMEYPNDKTNYPGIWVDFTPSGPIQIAGIDHKEFILDTNTHKYREVTRWRYSGQIQFTAVALSSLERDRIIDELIRVVAFGREDPSTATFRATLENNDRVACQAQWDRADLGGKAETPGTPWGTDEIIYEQTISMDCQGDFVALTVGTTATLVPLSAIVIYDQRTGEMAPQGYPVTYSDGYTPVLDPTNTNPWI